MRMWHPIRGFALGTELWKSKQFSVQHVASLLNGRDRDLPWVSNHPDVFHSHIQYLPNFHIQHALVKPKRSVQQSIDWAHDLSEIFLHSPQSSCKVCKSTLMVSLNLARHLSLYYMLHTKISM